MISIIITTKNSEQFIGKCIDAIHASTYRDYEIIVVDNESNDLTQQIADRKGATVYEIGPERSAQRNYGVAMAKGEYVLILDVDMQIEKELLEECVYVCEELVDADGLYIPERIIGEGFWIKVRNFERTFYDGTRVDALRFFKKSHWIDYDVTLTGAEDWDHDRRFKGKKDITFSGLNHDEGAFNFKRYLTKKGYYAQWMDKYRAKRIAEGDTYLPELDPKYRYWGVFMEDGKWKEVIRHPILFACTIFLKVLIGIKYITAKKV